METHQCFEVVLTSIQELEELRSEQSSALFSHIRRLVHSVCMLHIVLVFVYAAVVDNVDSHLAFQEVLRQRHCYGSPWAEVAELEGQVLVPAVHT